MTLPQKILINRVEDYQTDLIGICSDDTQFFIYETFVYTIPHWEIPRDKDWKDFRQEYLIKYLFDTNGNFISHNYWFGGTTSSLNHKEMEKRKKEMLSELGDYQLCDIEIKLFQTELNGHLFGLVANEEGESIDLIPGDIISFMEPWDGEYYT